MGNLSETIPDPHADPPIAAEDPSPTARKKDRSPTTPGPSLPVVDLIGLRFSLLHLRLAGYGLLAIWLVELLMLLSESDLGAIGSRLYHTTQFLDLSPILLAAIGLIAFQGGLRRRIWELLLLPLLLTLLPLLSALHLFLAPVTVANTVTLMHKQQQISRDQMERVDRQINRARSILQESDTIDALVGKLQRIPGLVVRVPANAPLQVAQREVRRSLERDRDRLQERIRRNLSQTREAFIRRSAGNAGLAIVVGLVLWGLHRGALQEMQQSTPFLQWVLTQGEAGQSHDVLRELLRFQRICLSIGWLALLERSVRTVRRRPGTNTLTTEADAEPEDLRATTPEDGSLSAAYPPPFEPGRLSSLTPEFPRVMGRFRLSPSDLPRPGLEEDERDGEARKPRRPFWVGWQRERQLRLAREALRRQGESPLFRAFQEDARPHGPAGEREGLDSEAEGAGAGAERDPLALTPAQMRARQRDLQRSRKALSRLRLPEFLVMIGQEEQPAPEPPSLPPARPGLLARLWRWFVSHL